MIKCISRARWLACFGVLALTAPVFAANQRVYVLVVDELGVVQTDAQVTDGSAKTTPASSTGLFVFNSALPKLNLTVAHPAIGEAQVGLSLPADGNVYVLASILAGKTAGNGVATRLVTLQQFYEVLVPGPATGPLLHSGMILPGTKPDDAATQGPGAGGACPLDSIFSQPVTPGADLWTFGVADEDFTAGPIHRWESYSVNEAICDVHWGGLELLDGFVGACTEAGGMGFEIIFYPDLAGSPDLANPACTYTASIPGVPTGEDYVGFAGQFYSLDLTAQGCCNLQSGWVEIHAGNAVGDDPGCRFLWGSSGDTGFGSSLIDDGTGQATENFDLSLCLTPSQGPPPNPETCVDCFSIGDTFSGTTTDNTASGEGDCLTSPDEWLCWTADCDGVATASLCDSGYDTKIGVFDAACSATSIACNDDNFAACGPGFRSEVSWAVTAGTEYHLQIGGFGADVGDYTLNMSCVGPPDNDDCATGQSAIAGDGSYPFDTTLGTTDGPDHAGAATCNKFGNTQVWNDVWYCWTAACDASVTANTCGASGDTKIAVYDGCTCPTDATNLLDCNDDTCGLQSEITWTAVGGSSYLIRVGAFSDTDFPSGDLSITSTPNCAPPTGADNCATGATPITGQGLFAFDNTTATTDGLPHASCDFFGQQGADNDVWFCWTADCTDVVRLETCALTGVDTKLVVYDGCTCPTDDSTKLNCNDDDCGLQSGLSFNAVTGNSYLIRVGTFPGAAGGTGEFSLSCGAPAGPCGDPAAGDCCAANGTPGCDDQTCCDTICGCDAFCCDTAWDDGCAGGGFGGSGCGAAILCPVLCAPPPAPANDLCADAEGPLAVPSLTAGSSAGATDDTGAPSPCGTAVSAPGVWYTVIGTGNTMTATTCENLAPAGSADYDTKINVYCKGCTPGEITCVDGNDDEPGCSFHSAISWCTQAGVEYLILVNGFGGQTGNFSLSVSDDGATCTGAVACAPSGACCVLGDCSVVSADACTAAGGDFLGVGVSCDVGGSATVFSSSPGLAIPDGTGPAVGVSDVINVAGSLTIDDLEIGVNIAHSWVGDLTVTIEHNAVSVELVNQPGDPGNTPGSPFGCGEDNYNIKLDDEGTGGAIEDQCVPGLTSPPNYIPNSALAPFIGTDAQGDWTITVTDTAGADVGSLVSWTVEVTEAGAAGPPPVCTPQGACCQGDGTCAISEELACTGAYLGDGVPCNSAGTPIGVSGTPGVAIPDGDPFGGVSDTINMGTSLSITDVDVDLGISHTWVGDLRVEIEHLGTTVIVVNQPGDPGNVDGSPFGCGNNDYAITLDDAGSGGAIEDQCGADGLSSPPSYTPNNPLSAFNGMEAAGDWTISVFDTAGADTGTLDSWGVNFGEQPGSSNCPVCGNGLVEAGEDCDDSNTAAGDCCSADCLFEDTSTVCNASTGVCDPPETCDGAGSCAADVLADSSTVCRPSTADCDPGENCTGSSADCPANVVITVCQSGTPAINDGCCPAGCNANDDDDCTPICGNGVIEGDEQCDDGNNDPGDGCDGVCVNEGPPVPTVSQWGLLVLALMLLVGAKVYFGRRHATA